jgi:proteasome activator subunit 4
VFHPAADWTLPHRYQCCTYFPHKQCWRSFPLLTTYVRLKDPLAEVRKSAAAALPSIFRICNHEERSHFSSLYLTWSNDAEAIVRRKSTSEPLTLRHAGVLGLSSLIQYEPFSVLEWMPALLERLAVHTSDPEPIKTSALLFFSQFWTTHRDSWNLYTPLFNPALLDTLMELFRGHRSYYI